MAITDRTLIRPGVTLIGRYKGTDYRCQVQAFGPGDPRIAFVLPNIAQTFTSLSKAASFVCHGISRNGWDFWTIEDANGPADASVPDVEVMARGAFEDIVARASGGDAFDKPRRRKAAPKTTGMVRCIKRVANQLGVPEGQIKHYCSCCMGSFLTVETDPQECPKGHAKLQADDLEPTAPEVAVG